MTELPDTFLQTLTPKSSADDIQAVLELIALAAPDPIKLEQALRQIAQRVGTNLKPVRQSYEMVQKKLNLKPNDLGLSIAKELLAMKYVDGSRLKLTKDGLLFAYSDTHWVQWSENKLRADIQEVAAKYNMLTDKTLHSLVNDAMGSLKDYLGSNQDVLSMTDIPPSVINFQNGELHIDADGTVELRPHKPESHLRYCLPYTYDPKTECETFDQALMEIFSEAKEPAELCRHVLEFLGYAIQPRRNIACFWLMIGHGANGKTTFIQTMCRLISTDYLYNLDMASFGRDKFNTSQLAGKLVMVDDDLKLDTVLPDGLLKKISESKLLTARNPYGKQSFTFLNAALPVMVGNHYPLCNDLSHGLLRRAMILPFQRQFLPHEQDSSKFDHIWANEMPGVVNRAIEGLQRLIKRGKFDPPKECIDARHDFLAHGNPFFCFMNECLEEKVGERILLPDFRAAYEMWAKQQNVTNLKVLNKTLKRRLQSLGYEIGFYNGYPCITGYALKMLNGT